MGVADYLLSNPRKEFSAISRELWILLWMLLTLGTEWGNWRWNVNKDEPIEFLPAVLKRSPIKVCESHLTKAYSGWVPGQHWRHHNVLPLGIALTPPFPVLLWTFCWPGDNFFFLLVLPHLFVNRLLKWEGGERGKTGTPVANWNFPQDSVPRSSILVVHRN